MLIFFHDVRTSRCEHFLLQLQNNYTPIWFTIRIRLTSFLSSLRPSAEKTQYTVIYNLFFAVYKISSEIQLEKDNTKYYGGREGRLEAETADTSNRVNYITNIIIA